MRRGFLIAVLIIAGCERTVPAPTATTLPAATQTATTTVTTRPAAVISINGHSGVFPPARLRLESDDQHIIATLFSDDPKEALKNNYKGNSFYLRMELDISDAAELTQTQWRYQAPSSSSEREESPYGIFLVGRKTQLEPFDVTANFRRDGDAIVVDLAGQFQIIEASTTRGPAKMAAVAAELVARVDPIKK